MPFYDWACKLQRCAAFRLALPLAAKVAKNCNTASIDGIIYVARLTEAGSGALAQSRGERDVGTDRPSSLTDRDA